MPSSVQSNTNRRFRDFFPDLRSEAMKAADKQQVEESLARGYKERADFEQYLAAQQGGSRRESDESRRS
jgi:hypothetical protein